MALIKRRKPNDSIKKFELSAEHKYQAGLMLLEAGDATTGIEQLGYAAEMLIKSAYFRFMRSRIGLQRITSMITGQMLRDAAQEGKRLHIRYDPESYHSLLFWALLVVATRWDYLRRLPQEMEKDMLSRIRQIHLIWMIEDRYQPKQYRPGDVLRMRANVTWIRENHPQLWR